MSSAPTLSVCIPSYNQYRYIAPALDSILSQNLADFELLVVDDCSTDGTRDIVAGYAGRDRRIRLIENPRNLGMVPNWNACLTSARGTYIKYLFGDDLLTSPGALDVMVSMLEADPSVSLVTSARGLIDEDGRGVGMVTPFPRDSAISGQSVITRCLVAQRNLVGEPSAVLFRRRQAERGFDESYRQFVDLEMWFHLLEQGKLWYSHQPLVAFRLHEGQQTRVNVRNLVHIEELLRLFDDYLERWGSRRFSRWFLVLGQYYRIWKLYRQGSISRTDAETRIEKGYGLHRFHRNLPLYKAINPLWKLRLLMDRRFS